ncbi:hypothetical protein [Pseudomonas syringae]|nr:hypothetical protein [Pseudomonas syringae]
MSLKTSVIMEQRLSLQAMPVVSHCDINPASTQAAPTAMSTLRI